MKKHRPVKPPYNAESYVAERQQAAMTFISQRMPISLAFASR